MSPAWHHCIFCRRTSLNNRKSPWSLHSWWKTKKEEPDKTRSYLGWPLNNKEDFRSLRSWWTTKKEELDKAKSYLGGQRQNMKKKGMTHIKEKEEREEEQHTEYRKRENSKKNT